MKNEKPGKLARFKIGLRGQQVVLFLLVSLTPLLVVSLTIKYLGTSTLKSSVGEGLVQLAQEKLFRIDRAISDKIGKIYTELPNIRSVVTESNNAKGDIQVFADAWQRLEDSVRLFESYAGSGYRRRGFRRANRSEVTITNSKGDVLCSNNRTFEDNHKNNILSNVADQNWWNRAFSNNRGYQYIEDVEYDETQNVHFISAALPIRTGNIRTPIEERKTVGVLRVVLNLRELANIVELRPQMEKTYTILTSQSGRIIAASAESNYKANDQMQIENATARAIIEAKKGRNGDFYGYEAEGEEDRNFESRVYGWARTRPSRRQPWKNDQNFANWIVFVSYPTSQAFAGVVKLNQYVLWVTLASCVIVIPIAYMVAQRITQPVMQLTQTAKRIGQEAKDVIQQESNQIRQQIAKMQWYQDEDQDVISVDSRNEVGMLAQEFNDMHHSLKIAVDKLINAEEQMTTIVDCLGEGLIVVNTSDQILYFNPAAKYLLNFDETSQFPNRFTELLRATNLTVLENAQAQDTRATVEINLDKEGENRILRVVSSQYASTSVATNTEDTSTENPNMAGMIYVFDDITREHEIDKMKSDFVALVSHELRTPLTSIIGFISLILDGKAGPLNDVQQQSLTRAHRQSKRLATMINDLLDISRIEAGRIVMKLEPVNIGEIAEQRVEELKPQADEKTVKLDLNIESELPQPSGDAEYIGQILTNLVGNAIKFTPENGEVDVKISRKGYPHDEVISENIDDQDGIHVEVIDTGPGIPEQERESVFDKFRQLSNIQTREQGGSGLGLSIAQGFVEAHKGKIWVDTGKNNMGCNFQFWIPFLS
ncbi:HAMP domain-containing protein [Candidatus Poribacteria bacterium]|nr:HAMP domain-containing protein [Candidatus Poribacteria bacterium]